MLFEKLKYLNDFSFLKFGKCQLFALNVFSNQRECQTILRNHPGKSTTDHRRSYREI